MSEEDLAEADEYLTAARTGDGLAFRKLAQPVIPVMLRVAQRVLRSETAAEDVVQESLMIVYRKLSKIEDSSKVRAYFLGVVARRAYSHLRSERRRAKREQQAETYGVSTPHDNIENLQLRQKIDTALQSLSKRKHQIAILRLDAGLTHQEIALALGSTERSVRVQYADAVKQLRSILSSEVGGGHDEAA